MKRFILLIFALTCSTSLLAQWNKLVVNYDKQECGFGTHTWGISPYDGEWIYFANNEGLWEFNANQWRYLPPLSRAEIRSVMPSRADKRIYVGAISEFGYYQSNEAGVMTYTSLADSLPAQFRSEFNQNVWNICEADNIIYFQGDYTIIRCINDELFVVDSEHKIYSSAVVNGSLYIGTNNGLYMLTGRKLQKLDGCESLHGDFIRSIEPYRGGMLVASTKGLYTYEDSKLKPFKSGMESFLEENLIFSTAVSGTHLAVGTIRGGVAIFDSNSGDFEIFDRETGLQSNTVLSLSYVGNRLWLGLDGGIDCILHDLPFWELTDNADLGSGYDAKLHGDYLYLATNNGLHYLHKPLQMSSRSKVNSIASAEGQCWRLASVGDEILSLQDAGVFRLKDGTAERITDLRGAWSFAPIPGRDDAILVGTYNALNFLVRKDGQWSLSHIVEGFHGGPYNIIFTKSHELAFFDAGAVTTITLDSDYRRVVAQKRHIESGASSLSKVCDTVCVATNEGIMYLDTEQDSLRMWDRFDIKSFADHMKITQFQESVVFSQGNHMDIVDNDGRFVALNMPKEMTFTSLSKMVCQLNDSLAVLSQENGFSLLDMKRVDRAYRGSRIVVREIYNASAKDSLLYQSNYMGTQPKLQLPYSMNSLRFEVATTSFASLQNVVYQYRLSNGLWSDWSELGVKEFNNIPHGEHTFSVRALLPNRELGEQSFEFVILPPWYQSGWAYCGYVLLLLLLVYLSYFAILRYNRYNANKLIAQKNSEIQEQQRAFDLEREHQQALILKMEKERVEHELRSKSLEVANLMVNSMNKNSVFVHVKEELAKVRRAIGKQSDQEIVEILSQIDSKMDANITSEETLKRIESEFDLVHGSFMQHLEQKHPNLNYNERMMCAYLKAGLSTKEIAPLLNISTRGVETLRYRIRKKFDLSREDSLRGYLHNQIVATEDQE